MKYQDGAMAVDASTGAVRWNSKIVTNPYQRIAVAGAIGIASTERQLICFKIANGAVIWRKRPPMTRTLRYIWHNRVLVVGGKLYALATPPVRFPAIGMPIPQGVVTVQAISLREGKTIWARWLPGVVSDGVRLLGITQQVYVLSLHKRKPHYRLVGIQPDKGAIAYSSPLPAMDWLSCILQAGHLMYTPDQMAYQVKALSVGTRRQTWKIQLDGRLLPTDPLVPAEGKTGKQLLIATMAGLIAVSPLTGDMLWSNRFVHPAGGWGMAVSDQQYVYILVEAVPRTKRKAGRLSVLDQRDGTLLTAADLPGRINPTGSLVAARGAVFVSCTGKESDSLIRFDIIED